MIEIEKEMQRYGLRQWGPAAQTGLVPSYDLLRQLGLRPNSTSFFHVACAIRIGARQPQRLMLPEWIYPEVAKWYDVSVLTIREDVKKISRRAWILAPEMVQKFAGEPLRSALPPTKFLTALASALRTNKAA